MAILKNIKKSKSIGDIVKKVKDAKTQIKDNVNIQTIAEKITKRFKEKLEKGDNQIE